MQLTLDWKGGAQFSATTGSGHTLTIDGPPDIGGENLGPRPMEMILLGVASCSAMDVVMILNKARQPVRDIHVEITGKRADAVPAVFTDMHLTFVVKGEGLSDKQVARAVKLSAEKYCSASIMLQEAVNITHEYRVEA